MVARLSAAELRAWEEIRDDPKKFMIRLTIQDTVNRERMIRRFLHEQEQWVNALCTGYRFIYGVKPRQVGWTTGTMAYLLWKLFTSSRARQLMQVVHQDAAIKRLHRMVNVALQALPDELHAPLAVDNRWRTEFSHNGAAIQRILAGGSGQGRSDTYTDFHGTEMSKWKSGTAAVSSQEGLNADEEMFGSAIAAMHDPTGQVVVESTGNGPRGLYHRLFLESTSSAERSKWRVVFVSWLEVPDRYRERLGDVEAMDLERELDDEEQVLVRDHGATLEQIAWRRTKMRTLRMTPLMFRREFPTVITDPFRIMLKGWFNANKLDVMLSAYIPKDRLQASPDDELVVHMPPEPGRRYGMGFDTSGGVGEDEACLQLLRDDGVHVATWASRWAAPAKQAHMVSRVGGMYGGPSKVTALIERNNRSYGDKVIEHVQRLGGVSLWTDADGELWWTDPASKRSALVNARESIDEGFVVAMDFETVRQLSIMTEGRRGNIAAPMGEHDDRAMAWVFAHECVHPGMLRAILTPEAEKERIARERARQAQEAGDRVRQLVKEFDRGARRR